MKRLAYAIRLFLPSFRWILVYWIITVLFIAMAGMGLKEKGRDAAVIWGLPLHGFGGEACEILKNAYMEMMYHAWTFVTLPFVCFIGMSPIIKAYRRDFAQFLRYSRSSRLFIEVTRVMAVLAVTGIVSLPFAAGILWGISFMGLNWHEALDVLISCGGTILFVCVLIYLLAFLSVPVEITVALAIVIPFFLTGLLAYLERVGSSANLRQMLPPGLPYSVYDQLPSNVGSFVNTNVQSGIVIALGIIVLRLLVVSRTRWLLATADSPLKQSSEGKRLKR